LLLGVVLVELELGEALVELELEVAPGAVVAFWSVVDVCPEVALLWLELDGVADWFISELLLLVDGVALEVDDGFWLVELVAAGVWF
jgi:hypothetical protein